MTDRVPDILTGKGVTKDACPECSSTDVEPVDDNAEGVSAAWGRYCKACQAMWGEALMQDGRPYTFQHTSGEMQALLELAPESESESESESGDVGALRQALQPDEPMEIRVEILPESHRRLKLPDGLVLPPNSAKPTGFAARLLSLLNGDEVVEARLAVDCPSVDVVVDVPSDTEDDDGSV